MSASTDENKSKAQFSLRASVVLTGAVAIWLWIFREMPPEGLAVFGGVALTAGIAGHVVYVKWLPWRVTVMATVLLLYNALLGVQVLLSDYNDVWFLVEIVVMPLEMMRHVKAPRDILFLLTMVLATLIFTAAHSIRPSLPSAIITALGIAVWYCTSIMIMMSAG